MNRRQAITTLGLGGAGLAASQISCGGPSVSGTVRILSGAASELKILFPAQGSTLDKIVTLGTDFDKFWVAGKFDSAKTVFENLDTIINQVITDLGVNANTHVKLLLATLGIALRTVAAIIAEQGQNRPLAARRAGATAPATVNRVNQLADPSVADRLLKAVKTP
jgi:hypothetical protein